MSQTLYWEPHIPKEAKTLGLELRQIIAHEYGHARTVLGASDFRFLAGVRAGAGKDSQLSKDCTRLLEEIDERGAVIVWIE